jgi:hypothetical protein
MKTFLQLACSARIAQSALRVALVVGTVLNAINQGGAILAGNSIVWFHLLMNYFVPYCVASYSAAKNEISRSMDE